MAGAFFEMFRALCDGPLALGPRHPSWFTSDAARLLVNYDVARVAADPARVPHVFRKRLLALAAEARNPSLNGSDE